MKCYFDDIFLTRPRNINHLIIKRLAGIIVLWEACLSHIFQANKLGSKLKNKTFQMQKLKIPINILGGF